APGDILGDHGCAPGRRVAARVRHRPARRRRQSGPRLDPDLGGSMYGRLKDQLTAELEEIRGAGLFKAERRITTPQSSHISASAPDGSAREVLNFCANNYLGLADHAEIIAAAKAAMDERGFGMASVRFICGTQD